MTPLDSRIASLLAAIASEPRPSGSPAITAARERCARELREDGYDVREQPFEFSEFPGRFATPLLGGSASLIVGFAGASGARGARILPLALLVLGAIALVVSGQWLARRGVLAAPLMRQRGVNLEAVPRGQEPDVWLCAHLDSKSQPVPTLVRSAGIVLESLGYLATLAIAATAAIGWGGEPRPAYWTLAAVVTLVGAIPVVLSIVGWRSPGALDNASGVVAVLQAARDLKGQGIGVVITDGEELGLAGARAWAQQRKRGTVLNCDGADDKGRIVAMFTGAKPTRILSAIAEATESSALHCDAMRMFPGVLTDSVAFTDAGLESVTFSRGSWRSLARVHSGRDNLAHLGGTGVAEVQTLMRLTAIQLRGEAAH